MTQLRIRPVAICVFWHRGRILVNESHDPVRRLSFCRPLGGGIEFGETSAQAVAREIREEIRAEVTDLRRISTLENIFTHRGVACHEIVQVYDGAFIDPAFYRMDAIGGEESDGQPFQAVWRGLDSFSPERPLFPHGLVELIQLDESRRRAAT